jgi:hypothetical protein
MTPFPCLWQALQDVTDPRGARGQRYPFTPLMVFTVLAVLAGARSYRDVITFIRERRHQLNELFGTRLTRAPALNTLRDLLHSLSRGELEAAFRRHAQDLASPATTDAGRPVIALDGKTLKRSFDQLNDQAAAATLSAFASDDALILAHTELDGTSHEAAAVQEMIADLNVSGVLFTVDALHCQKNL